MDELRIAGIGLNVASVERATAFYAALGFTEVGPGEMVFGHARLELATATGAAYPEPRAANDPWFQHFAVAVADIEAAAAAVLAAGATPISRGGPQLLPPNTGSVTAYKFRDPDGHALELSLIPGSGWLRDAKPGAMFLGVDHTAIAVADLVASQSWYEARGFRETGRSRNTGPEQDRLDGLDGVVVDIVALAPERSGPHLELLCYQTPKPAPPQSIGDHDVAATKTIAAGGKSEIDPDGHRIVSES
ncbi:VOC family protein [Polymorphobacter sp. PAMC 29334]|uniref:VOC family protein n=1 Tax=Polymorphobacter sp. PAMC 29334 TaxID=2862331 RepID=UPI001C680A66|nr:VOC family protein [Polymorphobacter sp. PAMC 29334]QYE33890.1 VOC family protein [Polymorphobacter sp. PAMC 29334]